MVRPGALERRSARRPSVRACGAAAAAIRPLARFQCSGVFWFFFSPPAEVCGITLKGRGERVAGDFRAVPRFPIAAPEPASPAAGSALGVHPRGEPAGGGGGERGAGGARPPPSPHCGLGAGRGAGGAAGRRGGRAAGKVRSPGRAERGNAARCLTETGRSSWHLAALRPPTSCSGAAQGTSPPRQPRERPPPPRPGRTFSVAGEVGSAEKSGPGAASHRRSSRGAGRGLRRAAGKERGARRRRQRRKDGAAALALGVVCGRPDTMALAEVVVCAVGRVVTLPAVEITAQATALLVLVMLSAAEDNGREAPLFSGAQQRPPGARPARPPRRPLGVGFPGGRRELQGEGCTGTFLKRV
nr:translation initiation factor IF-2-like [Desmodus rotundus]